jgi:putative glutamine amidotransferase
MGDREDELSMAPRIAIPMPHGVDLEYAERAIPQYERAVELAGGEPVRIALGQSADEVRKAIEPCDGVLLPGSKADVDPARFHAAPSQHTAAADPRRDAIDDLLLDDAYRLRKPVLGICYGLQSLNVYRSGSLVQHIPEFLPEAARAKVNHEAGKAVAIAHTVEIEEGSRLAEIVRGRASCGDSRFGRSGRAQPGGCTQLEQAEASVEAREGKKDRASAPEGDRLVIPVNSSHHQSADAIGKGLRIVARCFEDGIIEALEGTAPNHFVLAVQWHPERSVMSDAASPALFRAMIEAATRK